MSVLVVINEPITMVFKNNSDFINDIIISNNDEEITNFDVPQTFLIHSSVFSRVLESLTRMEVDILQHLGNYELTVGEYTFDMEILVIGSTRANWRPLIPSDVVHHSQLAYIWEEKFTLFREVDRYYELEKFISINHLNKHVISIEEVSGVNSLCVPIKIVTFDGIKNHAELFIKYVQFLKFGNFWPVQKHNRILHYYFTKALPWHKPEMLNIYSIPFKNQRIFLELQTFLTCMRELKYSREPYLDLISLCSLKLAFCDVRNVTEASRDLEFEVDALIERFLRRMQRNETYIKNGNFDMIQYAIDTNSQFFTSYSAVINLIFTFQHIFHCTNLTKRYFDYSIRGHEMTQTLMFIDQYKDLKVLRDRFNIPYDVDAKNYNKMNSKLFCGLLKCHNVQDIRLDTNYKWTNDPCFTDFDVYSSKRIVLVGTNKFNFIENFIQFLIAIPISLTFKIELKIEEVTLNNYNIFKNLKVGKLIFCNSKITFTMLTQLIECDSKYINIEFCDCKIEDQTCTWSLLMKRFDRENVVVRILEKRKTWQYLFESIANHLTKLKLNKFKFKCLLSNCNEGFAPVCVSTRDSRCEKMTTKILNFINNEIKPYNSIKMRCLTKMRLKKTTVTTFQCHCPITSLNPQNHDVCEGSSKSRTKEKNVFAEAVTF